MLQVPRTRGSFPRSHGRGGAPDLCAPNSSFLYHLHLSSLPSSGVQNAPNHRPSLTCNTMQPLKRMMTRMEMTNSNTRGCFYDVERKARHGNCKYSTRKRRQYPWAQKKKKRLQGQAPKSHGGSVCLSNTEDLVPSSLDLTNGQHSVHTPF